METKTCYQCQETLPRSDFHNNKARADGLSVYCKACSKDYSARRWKDATPDKRAAHIARSRQWDEDNRTRSLEMRNAISKRYATKNRAKLLVLKSNSCMDCGRQYPHYCMDFDHREGVTKTACVSRMVTNKPWHKIASEIAKCDLVCSNCHRIRTHERRQRQCKNEEVDDIRRASES